jgi:hypothetical protein
MSCALSRLEHDFDRLLARPEIRCEAPLVPDRGCEAALVQQLPERVKGLRADLERFGE